MKKFNTNEMTQTEKMDIYRNRIKYVCSSPDCEEGEIGFSGRGLLEFSSHGIENYDLDYIEVIFCCDCDSSIIVFREDMSKEKENLRNREEILTRIKELKELKEDLTIEDKNLLLEIIEEG